MKENINPYGKKFIERKLSRIGAKTVKATELAYSAKKLCEKANVLLIDVQMEIADLYESLADIWDGPEEGDKCP